MSKHAIIIIKNDKNEYLQYYDNRWNSYLFLNCKINDSNDIEKIRKVLYEKLHTDIKDVSYIMNKTHTKFSQSDKIYKEYQHFFFVVNMSIINSMLNKTFCFNNTNFKWYSYEELLCDKRIMEVNSDIVSFVNEIK